MEDEEVYEPEPGESDEFIESHERRRRRLEDAGYDLSRRIQTEAYNPMTRDRRGLLGLIGKQHRDEIQNLRLAASQLKQQRHDIIEDEREHRRRMADAKRAEAQYRKIETLWKQLEAARIRERKAHEALQSKSSTDFSKEHEVTKAEKTLRDSTIAKQEMERRLHEHIQKYNEASKQDPGWFGTSFMAGTHDPAGAKQEEEAISNIREGRVPVAPGEKEMVKRHPSYQQLIENERTAGTELKERRGGLEAELEQEHRARQAQEDTAKAEVEDYENQLRSYGVDPMGAPTPAPPMPQPQMPQPRPGMTPGGGGGPKIARQGGQGTGIPALNITPQQTSLHMPTGGLLGMLGKGLGGIGQGLGGIGQGIGSLLGGGGKGGAPGMGRGPQIGPGGPPMPPRRPQGLGVTGPQIGPGGVPMPPQRPPGLGQAAVPQGAGPQLPPGAMSPVPFAQQGGMHPIRGNLDAIPMQNRTGMLAGQGQAPFQRTPMPPQRPGMQQGGGGPPISGRAGHLDAMREIMRQGAARGMNITPQMAASIAGNLSFESGGNTMPGQMINLAGRGDSGTAIGMGQWRGSRQRGVGNTLQSQTSHLLDEMQGGDPGAARAYRHMQGGSDPGAGARTFMNEFERPSASERVRSLPSRERLAQQFYRDYMGAGGGGMMAGGGGGGARTPMGTPAAELGAPMPQPRPQPQQPQGQQQAPQQQQPPMPPRRPPQRGEIQDGYMFKGGNPADKGNWQKAPGGPPRRPPIKRPDPVSAGALGRLQQRWGMGMQ